MRSNNMASEKALYWMAVGLLELVVGNHFVSKFDGRCLAYRSQAVAERISAKTDRLVAMADLMLGRTSTRIDRAETMMVVSQARLASMQSSLTRQQVACARIEASRARMVVQQQLQQMRIPVVYPSPRIQMVMPRPEAAPNTDPI
jgi:hypothetical protein